MLYVPQSKLHILGMVIPPLIGNPYNGYINPYYWVDDHPLLYGNNGSLDPSAYTVYCKSRAHFQLLYTELPQRTEWFKSVHKTSRHRYWINLHRVPKPTPTWCQPKAEECRGAGTSQEIWHAIHLLCISVTNPSPNIAPAIRKKSLPNLPGVLVGGGFFPSFHIQTCCQLESPMLAVWMFKH